MLKKMVVIIALLIVGSQAKAGLLGTIAFFQGMSDRDALHSLEQKFVDLDNRVKALELKR